MVSMIPMNEILPSLQTWQSFKVQAVDLIKSGFLPSSIKTPEQLLAIALKGRELGLPIMYSLTHIHVVQGKPTQSAESMLARIYQTYPGVKIEYEAMTDTECVMVVAKPGHVKQYFSFVIEDAKRAGLLEKSVWRQYPKSMLRARCISDMARALFPECLGGISYTPEELGASVNGEGEIVEVETKPKKDDNPRGFDPTNDVQRAWLETKCLQAKLSEEETKIIFEKMVGKSSSDFDEILKTVKQ